MRARAAAIVCVFASLAAGCRQAAPPSPAPSAAPRLRADLDAAVLAHRRIIVLVEDTSLPPADRARADLLGRVLFEENRHRLEALETRLREELLAAAGSAPSVPAFLDALEREPDWRDADKLVFRDLVSELLAVAGEPRPPRPALLTRLREDDAALRRIQSLYEKELERIFGQLATRGMTLKRETWDAYVAFLRGRMRAKDILEELKSLIGAGGETMRGGDSAAEMTGARLPRKGLVLTFDDGPHPRHTEKIQAILDRFAVKALFFNVGENLGALGSDDKVKSTPASAASRKLRQDGFPLANHSYTHAFLPKLDDAQLTREIELTNRMLKDVDPGAIVLFRAPYGARDARVLAAIQAHGMKSVMWNIDSRDWADPVPISIANRVIQAAEAEGRGIILFHDIQARTVEALPLVIETLQSRGYRFLEWNGSDFVDSGAPTPLVAARSGAATPAAAPSAPSGPLYRESFAVVIGVDDYKHWPRLSYAVNDAQAVRDLLVEKQHFKPENVALLLNGDATRERILFELGDRLADPQRVTHEDRVFVFFAGHGATRRLPNGRNLGYIIPVEAGQAEYQSQAISMTNFQDVSEAIPAKHILYVTDACYSGVALTRGGGDASGAYLKEMARRSVRQMLTAGGADQEVADNGPNGHSIFTWALLQGLDGRADLSGDGYVTGAELAAYVGPTVSALSHQTPAFGNLVGSEGGEFVFELRHENEFLSDVSSQLDDEAVTLNAELEKIRTQIAEKRARNEALKQEVQRAQAALAASPSPTSATPAPENAAQRNDRGMALYRARQHPQALSEFEAAARLAPSVALYANNVGFAQFKLGKLEESVVSFRRTLELDPKRAVAALNLGDALVALSRKDEAVAAYDKYLELAPTARNAEEIRAKRDALK